MSHLERRQSDSFIFQVEGCQLYTAYSDYPQDPVETNYESLVYGCEAGNGRFEIMHDGIGLPCALFDVRAWGAGNVFEGGLQHVWDTGQSLQRLRSYKNRDSTCNSCRFGSFCNGGCPALNELEHGNIETLGDSRCEIRSNMLELKQEKKRILYIPLEGR